MNKKIKILWFCSDFLTEQKTTQTGTWLHTMSKGLVESGLVELFNVTNGSNGHTFLDQDMTINQWILPRKKLNRKGIPNKKIIKDIQNIVLLVQPDIIHIWGTESYWGLLSARNLINGKVLLEIQGLKFEISKYFYKGLSKKELLSCINIKEILKPSVSIFSIKKAFSRWGTFEKEMILNHRYINTQSEWVRATVGRINKEAKIYNTLMLLRDEFYHAEKWNLHTCKRNSLFTITSEIISYKGLHVLFDAIAILKRDFPDIKLNIASNLTYGIRRGGYTRFLFRKIKRMGLTNNICWLGPLTAEQIVKELQSANVVVIPSFVESYCMALEEAIFVGVPTVASFAGAMPELGKNKETVSFFQPGDAGMCAYEIIRILQNDDYALKMSNKAFKSKLIRNNSLAIEQQIQIYQDLLNQ